MINVYKFLKTTLSTTWEQMKQQGFWATWQQLVDLSDPRGEINAYRVSRKIDFFFFYKYNYNAGLFII